MSLHLLSAGSEMGTLHYCSLLYASAHKANLTQQDHLSHDLAHLVLLGQTAQRDRHEHWHERL